MDAALSLPRTSSLTIKLDGKDRERLKSLAVAKKRSSHYLMREAIQKYLDDEEAEQRFVAAAEEALSDYQKNGLHITLGEFSQWAKDIQNSPKATMPVCHD
jgi:predicted transcriptional regulator